MKLATIRKTGGTAAVRVVGDRYVEIPGYASVSELLAAGALDQAAQAQGTEGDFTSADLAPVVPTPGKIVCVGVNYRNHIKEMGREPAEFPTLFTKFPEALLGAHDDFPLPPESTKVDYEGEMALVIGTTVRRAKGAEAEAAIAGFTCANDGTMRDWQYRTTQWFQGKGWEKSTPLGPVLITPDELPADARMVTRVNGDVRQDTPVDDLLFGTVALVEYVSTMFTLKPGDVILTGTPGGVGHARKPPVYIQPGDVITVTIDGIGELRNTAVAEQL